jgi:hypothetical protein
MYPEFRQILVALHDKAARESETYAKSRTDQKSVSKSAQARTAPLDVEGTDLNVSKDEIVRCIAESRRYA